MKFMFVRKVFVRKAGVEFVKAFQEINKIGLFSIKLIFVIDVNKKENYAFKDNQLIEKEFRDVENIIVNSPWIGMFSNRLNEQIL